MTTGITIILMVPMATGMITLMHTDMLTRIATIMGMDTATAIAMIATTPMITMRVATKRIPRSPLKMSMPPTTRRK
jgi:hypothetical protein